MEEILLKYLPERSVSIIFDLIRVNNVNLKIVNERVTKHGDYRRTPDGKHQITINSNLNKYRFLITLIHEIAHFETYMSYGQKVKPHGPEWKFVFQQLMLGFLRPQVFPSDVLPLLASHFKNPKASSDSDALLTLKLKQYDPPNGKIFIFEVPFGSIFRLHNGKLFRKGIKRRTRFEGSELTTGRSYVFNPNAEVELVKDSELT